MEFFKKLILCAFGFNVILLLVSAVFFKVDDMTLSKGVTYNFNNGWVLVRNTGERELAGELPYLGESVPNERVIAENIIPKEYFGMTMSFLSADKTLRVWMDDRCVYEFGTADVRIFGHTPGSVVNFIDIPSDLKEGKIRIEMCSPYEHYAARLSTVTIGKRDVLILQLFQKNLPKIMCNLLIIVCALLFCVLCTMKRSAGQSLDGVGYLSGYCIITSFYYCVETKVLHIFYGNQTFYSVMVFVCVMMIPFFVSMYFANGRLGVYKKRWNILLSLISINIFVQIILQIFNIVDFMDMAFASHSLIALTVIVAGKSYYDILKVRKEKSIILGMAALLFMGIGGTIDIVRMYLVAVGDMGKFSRLGTAIFCIIMLCRHFGEFIKGYSQSMEENARYLKNEMEFMEKKNEQLKKANELAEEARQEAIAANNAKGKFLAHMSHEIRTPINAVLGMDTMILRETKDMQIKEYALDIQNAGQNLLALINDILDFSKIESGKLEIIQTEYDISSMIYDISNMVKAKAEAKKLKLNISVDENVPSKFLGDDVRIRQILINLLNNAVKYTLKGSVTLRINGRIDGKDAILDFSVEDTGIGIKEEDLDKLFKEFERIEEKRNRNIEGTGLGMNITVQLLKLMDSQIKVESTYGKGSRFYFTLKQQIVDSTPVGDLEERIRKQSAEYAYVAAFTAPDANILVVDDNLTNHKVFVSLLKRTKVNVEVADSGKQCLEMVANKHYDLIFLDHMMPEMDGIETLHNMQKINTNKCIGTPVIALTANAITGAKEMYLSEGFDAFLPKPINPERLEQMIIRLLPRELLCFEADEGEETQETLSSIIGKSDEEEELPIIDGIDWSYGLMHLPSKELLMETVGDFYKAIDSEADTLEKYYKECSVDENMLRQYRIKVHAMKSSANLVGAIVLGGMAKLLENAAKDADINTIESLNGIFLKEWRSYKEKLEEIVHLEAEEDKKEVEDYAVILSYLETLKSAFEEFDIDEMDKAMEQLSSYKYSAEIDSYMEKLAVQVINMDNEEAMVLIEKIIEKIIKIGE